MSIALMSAVWERCIYSTEQQVLLILCDHANDAGTNCYPSVPLIAWKIGVSDRTVRRTIKALEEKKVIAVSRSDGKANHYRIDLTALPMKQPLTQLCHPRQNVTPDIAMSGHPGHNSVTPTPDTAMSPEPPFEPPITTNTEAMPSNMVRIEAPAKPDSDAVLMDRFERWYATYPKKRSRGQAETTWRKIAPSDELTDQMIAAVESAKQSKEWLKEDGRFIPNPSTWLNAKGWLDDIATAPSLPAGIELLPGETAVETAPGEWEFSRGDQKRYLSPDYYGVIWDPQTYRGSDGTKAFRAAVAEAKQRYAQEAA